MTLLNVIFCKIIINFLTPHCDVEAQIHLYHFNIFLCWSYILRPFLTDYLIRLTKVFEFIFKKIYVHLEDYTLYYITLHQITKKN